MEFGKGSVRLEFLGHSGFLLEKDGKRIAIDPCNISDSKIGKVDVVLITHSHHNSCSIKDIERVVDKEKGTVVICPADCQSKILKLQGVKIEIAEVGDKMDFLDGGMKVETFPAYNKYRDDHPKSEGWLGFVIKTNDVVVYHAGDTDFIPEMQKLSGYGKRDNEFIALLPVSGKSVMNVDQASDAASIISPDLVIPMRYDSLEDAEKFVELCKEKGLKSQILEKI